MATNTEFVAMIAFRCVPLATAAFTISATPGPGLIARPPSNVLSPIRTLGS